MCGDRRERLFGRRENARSGDDEKGVALYLLQTAYPKSISAVQIQHSMFPLQQRPDPTLLLPTPLGLALACSTSAVSLFFSLDAFSIVIKRKNSCGPKVAPLV